MLATKKLETAGKVKEPSKASFCVYDCDGVAYILAKNWAACQVCHSFEESYRDYRPLKMTADMIEKLADGVARREYLVKHEKI